MRVDIDEARRVLRLESASSAPLPEDWVELIERLSEACEKAPKTHIAMLGTALLAKAVEPRVDVFALKTSAGTKGAYSARNLAKEALAALAPELRIDLGVTGREPLNNQPYFRLKRITPEMEDIIRGDGIPPFRIVLEGLRALEVASQEEARGALRAFLNVRAREARIPLDADTKISALPSELTDRIGRFVGRRSEGGKRAQAVAAALLDLVFGTDAVDVDRINDPDRHFPGDIGVKGREPPFSVVRVYEVRDKPVREHDLQHFIVKAYEAKARRAGVVCVAGTQAPFDISEAVDRAFGLGIALRVYFGWADLVGDVLFESMAPPRALLEEVGFFVYDRLMELEVSTDGLASWRQLVRELESPK